MVDNSPNPQTAAICQQATNFLPIRLHYVEEPIAGVTYARNRAVVKALELNADFVAFMDDDDLPQLDWLIHLLNRQKETAADMVLGVWKYATDVPNWLKHIVTSKPKEKLQKHLCSGVRDLSTDSETVNQMANDQTYIAGTNNMLIGRGLITRIAANGEIFSHNFRRSGGEDRDLMISAENLGAKITLAAASIIRRNFEAERYTPKGLLVWGFSGGCSKLNIARRHHGRWRVLRLTATALCKLPFVLALFPFFILSRRLFMHNLRRLGKSSGIIYAAFTRRDIPYYQRS